MKRATTVEEQIALLRSRGMAIADEEKAKAVLLDVGYYRLGFYWFHYEVHPRRGPRTHQFMEGTSFDDAVRLYYFDSELRDIVIQYIIRIEVNFRTSLIYRASLLYADDPAWFCRSELVGDEFVGELPAIYRGVRKNPVIARHHQLHPEDTFAPAWKTMEYLTFGEITRLYAQLKSPVLQNDIIRHYNISRRTFERYIYMVRLVRNLCAHGHNLFDFRPAQPLPDGKYCNLNGHNDDVVGCLMVVDYLLHGVSPDLSGKFKSRLRALVESPDNNRILPQIEHLQAFYE